MLSQPLLDLWDSSDHHCGMTQPHGRYPISIRQTSVVSVTPRNIHLTAANHISDNVKSGWNDNIHSFNSGLVRCVFWKYVVAPWAFVFLVVPPGSSHLRFSESELIGRIETMIARVITQIYYPWCLILHPSARRARNGIIISRRSSVVRKTTGTNAFQGPPRRLVSQRRESWLQSSLDCEE